MASHKSVLVENAVSKLHYLQFITMEISTLLNEHFQELVLFEPIETYLLVPNSLDFLKSNAYFIIATTVKKKQTVSGNAMTVLGVKLQWS